MKNNRRILRILENCQSEFSETSKLQALLSENGLIFTQPVTIDQLRNINSSEIVREAGAMERSSNIAQVLEDSIHVAIPILMAADDFI